MHTMQTDLAEMFADVTALVCRDKDEDRDDPWAEPHFLEPKYRTIVETLERSITPRLHITAYASDELRHI